jgi:hypothetical protein
MAIMQPELSFTKSEKELLWLLAKLIGEESPSQKGNSFPDSVALTDSEASRLVELLEELVTSKSFLEGAFFTEQISLGHGADLNQLRSIFTYWRAKKFRNRSMSWLHWSEFTMRLSAQCFPAGQRVAGPRKEMTIAYFKKMEWILLRNADVTPRVSALIVEMIGKLEVEIEATRNGFSPLKPGSIANEPKSLLNELKADRLSVLGLRSFPANRLAGILTIVADSTVMFTTRDWGVAGTLSTMAGAIATSIKSDNSNRE